MLSIVGATPIDMTEESVTSATLHFPRAKRVSGVCSGWGQNDTLGLGVTLPPTFIQRERDSEFEFCPFGRVGQRGLARISTPRMLRVDGSGRRERNDGGLVRRSNMAEGMALTSNALQCRRQQISDPSYFCVPCGPKSRFPLKFQVNTLTGRCR